MKQLIYFFSALIIISSILACGDKEDPESYEVRKREHRLFRCKVDGKEWTYTGKEYWDIAPHIRSGYYTKDSLLIIRAIYNPKKEEDVRINFYSQKGLHIGDSKLSKDTEIWGLTGEGSLYDIDMEYDQNTLFIQDIDTVNHIIKGTFRFKTEEYFEKVVLVTDGEFDLKINTWIKQY